MFHTKVFGTLRLYTILFAFLILGVIHPFAELKAGSNRPDLSGLTREERDSIEIACITAKTRGPAAYNQCLRQQLAELRTGTRRPDLSGLTREERDSIEIACITAKTRGPAAYNQCLRQQLAELRTGTRRPDLSGLTREERDSIEIACITAKTRGPAAYNQCLRQQLAELGEPIREIPKKKTPPKRLSPKPSIPPKSISPNDIRRAQTLLAGLGYYSGPIDGILGEQTETAIIEFQRDMEAPVTGEVNKKLISQLEIAYQIEKTRKKPKPPVQISKPSPKKYNKIPRVAKVLPVMPSKVNKQPLNAADLFRKVRTSVFVVVAGSSIQNLQRLDDLSQGSAVAVSNKDLLTNCHILAKKPYVFVIQGEESKAARLSGKDEESDMCVLTTKESNLTHVDAIRKFDDLIVGEKVYTVGTPIGLEQTLGEGIISGLRNYNRQKLIQTSAPISSGSSGGGLFDSNGNLIGITTFLLKDAQNLNFAIAAEQYWD